TVPIHSADVYNPDKNFDYRNGILNYYRHKVDHAGLAQDDTVLAFAIRFFSDGTIAANTSNTVMAFHSDILRDGQSISMIVPSAQIDGLSNTPEPLSGIELETLG